jgi:hypothetical protein
MFSRDPRFCHFLKDGGKNTNTIFLFSLAEVVMKMGGLVQDSLKASNAVGYLKVTE